MTFSGYILSEIDDIYGNKIIVPIAPTEFPYYVTPNGDYDLDYISSKVLFDKGEWVKSLFELYIYEPFFNLLELDDKIINIVVGSKFTKVYADDYYQAFKEIKSNFDEYEYEDMIDLEFETKLSLCVDLPNMSYSASRLFTYGDINKEITKYYNYILYIGRFYQLKSTGLCEPTDLFKVGSTSKSFNERYREFYKGDSSLRKIDRSIMAGSYIKCIESYIIPPFIDTEATISSLTRDSMRDESLDKRIIKDLFDGSKIKLRVDHIIYDSYYLAMCKLFNHSSINFNNTGEKRHIFALNSKGELTNIAERYIMLISNIMNREMNNRTESKEYSPIFNYILSQLKAIKINNQKRERPTIGINVSNTNNITNTNIYNDSSTFNSPFNNIDNSVNMNRHRVDREEPVDDIKMKIDNYAIKIVFIIDILLNSSTSIKRVPIEVINKLSRLFCEINRCRIQETLVKDTLIENLNKNYIKVI
jgi:hypothetical protein